MEMDILDQHPYLRRRYRGPDICSPSPPRDIVPSIENGENRLFRDHRLRRIDHLNAIWYHHWRYSISMYVSGGQNVLFEKASRGVVPFDICLDSKRSKLLPNEAIANSVLMVGNFASVIAPLIVGFAGLGAFVIIEWKVAKEPMVPLRIFLNRTANASFFGAFIHGLVLWAFAYYMIIFVRIQFRSQDKVKVLRPTVPRCTRRRPLQILS